MPMPATCWLTPIVTASRAISAPAAAPAATAAARPTQTCPLLSATRNPTKAPAYIVPSIPRLSTPARSPRIAPSAPYTSGVAIVSMPPSTASQRDAHEVFTVRTGPDARRTSR